MNKNPDKNPVLEEIYKSQVNQNFDENTRLGEIYKFPEGFHLTLEDMDLPVSVYNCLKRSGIHHLQQILQMSETDLTNTIRSITRYHEKKSRIYLIVRIAELSKEML